jgi:hypothetical protein
MQDDVDCVENRTHVEKPRPILGAIGRQARGQNIDVPRYWRQHRCHQARCRRDGVVLNDEQEWDVDSAYAVTNEVRPTRATRRHRRSPDPHRQGFHIRRGIAVECGTPDPRENSEQLDPPEKWFCDGG